MALTLGPVIGKIGQKYTTHPVAAYSEISLPISRQTLVSVANPPGSTIANRIDGTPTSVAVVTGPTVTVRANQGGGTVYLMPL